MEGRATVACVCGTVTIEVSGPPIMTCDCLCNSCRTAAQLMESLPGAPPLLDKHQGTRSTMYRKDKVERGRGSEMLREFRLNPASKTRRVVATCCNSPMFLDFMSGHWLDIYANRWPEGEVPAAEFRTMTGDLPFGSPLPTDIPNLKGHSPRFYARLVRAWIAMHFKVPRIDWVQGALEFAPARQRS